MPKQVEAWQCDYCKRRYSTKGNTRRHEKTCIFNPANKACITCSHSFYKVTDSEPGCKDGRIGIGEPWKRGCQYHKYQGGVGIDMDEDFEEGCTDGDYIMNDY